MFQPPADVAKSHLVDDLFQASLPATTCNACGCAIARRERRVQIRASWRGSTEVLCAHCWDVICDWAVRFAYQQLKLLDF